MIYVTRRREVISLDDGRRIYIKKDSSVAVTASVNHKLVFRGLVRICFKQESGSRVTAERGRKRKGCHCYSAEATANI